MSVARRWLVLLVVSLAFFMVELDITVVNVALPSIRQELEVSAADLQWVINAYLLTFGGFVLLAGRAADLLGRTRLFMAGTALFGVGSALCAFAPSAAVVVAGRALQGLGGALLTPTGLSTLTTTFTEPRERARALAVWTFIQTGSVAIGLTAGGVITQALSWRWIFLINLPVAVIALAAAPRLLPRTAQLAQAGGTARPQHKVWARFDVSGALASVAGPALLIYALAGVPAHGWSSLRTAGVLTAGLGVLAALVLVETRSRAPLIRLGIFGVRSLAVGNAAFLLASSALFGMFFFSSLYAQQVLGYRPLKAGLALLPLAAGVLAGVFAAQALLGRRSPAGPRELGTAGLGLAAAGTVLLTQITATSPYTWPFMPGLTLLALGLGLAMVSLTLLATSGVPDHEAGLASGLFTAVSYLGGALGLAVLSTLAAARTHGTTPADLVNGYHAAYLAAAALLATAALVLLTLLPHAPSHNTQHADT